MKEEEEKQKFLQACEAVCIAGKAGEQKGIGTLGEKTLHRVLKYFFEPNERFHEIKIHGYVADICNEEGVIEIQTRGFHRLRGKISSFLQEKQVTIVYPVAGMKYLSWIDQETGEIFNRRKSPKVGSIYEIFQELYQIKEYLLLPGLEFAVVVVEVEEYRNLNGWSMDKKKGSSRYERIPTGLTQICFIRGKEDYKALIPSTLPDTFLVKDYKKVTKLSDKKASIALHVLHHVGVVKRIGKKGNAYIYERS